MPDATVILSTGRCGTQWLAKHLAERSGPSTLVEHEPLQRYASSAELLRPPPLDVLSKRTLEHIAGVERRITRQRYIECGWPSWRAAGYLGERFSGRVRFVHLTRHPIPVACSWVAHGAYVPPLLPTIPERVLFSPGEPDAYHTEYGGRWDGMSPFEKVLFFWAEVHHAALRLRRAWPDIPWLRLTFEDLFHGDGLSRLAEFLELRPDGATGIDRSTRVDRYGFLLSQWWDPGCIGDHPRVREIAQQLGYDPFAFDETALMQRYLHGRC